MSANRLRAMVLAALLLRASTAFAQQPNTGTSSTPWSLFAAKQYEGYLSGIGKSLSEMSPERLQKDFTDLLCIAIAVEKTEGDPGAQKEATLQKLQGILKPYPDSLRWLSTSQKVLSGDLKAVADFFEEQSSSVAPGGRQDGDKPLHYQGSEGKSTPPPFEQWERVPATLKEHGYEVQSRLFSAVAVLGPMRNPEQMTQPLIDWLSFTGKERKFLDEFLQPYLNKDPPKLRELCNLLFNLYQRGGATAARLVRDGFFNTLSGAQRGIHTGSPSSTRFSSRTVSPGWSPISSQTSMGKVA